MQNCVKVIYVLTKYKLKNMKKQRRTKDIAILEYMRDMSEIGSQWYSIRDMFKKFMEKNRLNEDQNRHLQEFYTIVYRLDNSQGAWDRKDDTDPRWAITQAYDYLLDVIMNKTPWSDKKQDFGFLNYFTWVNGDYACKDRDLAIAGYWEEIEDAPDYIKAKFDFELPCWHFRPPFMYAWETEEAEEDLKRRYE